MRLDIEHALSEKFAVSAILFVHQKKVIYKYDLRSVTTGRRQIEKLVTVLNSTHIIWVDDISNRNKKEYRIGLTNLGINIAKNLERVEEKGEISEFFLEIWQEMLMEIYSSGARYLAELSQVKYFDEGKKLLIDLDEKGVVEIEKDPSGILNLSSPVPFTITTKGKVVAKKLLEAKKAIEE